MKHSLMYYTSWCLSDVVNKLHNKQVPVRPRKKHTLTQFRFNPVSAKYDYNRFKSFLLSDQITDIRDEMGV